MPVCLQQGPDGVVVINQRTDFVNCEFVVLTGVDYQILGKNDLMRLTPEQGVQLSLAIGLVWGTAYVFKLVGKAIDLNSDEGEK